MYGRSLSRTGAAISRVTSSEALGKLTHSQLKGQNGTDFV